MDIFCCYWYNGVNSVLSVKIKKGKREFFGLFLHVVIYAYDESDDTEYYEYVATCC